ncbi:hypothetical protein M0802_011101 [Mischocyttarus mexicanus]|nr:hypothetical protein M0802_011101 [Mischocyttarus mexicanus]
MSKTNKKQKKASTKKEKKKNTFVPKANLTTIKKKKNYRNVDNIKKRNNASDRKTIPVNKLAINNNKSKIKKLEKTQKQPQVVNENNKQNKKVVKKISTPQRDQTKSLKRKSAIKKKYNNPLNNIQKPKKVEENKVKNETKKEPKTFLRLKEMFNTFEKSKLKPKKLDKELPLRERMMTLLKGSRFRYLNEVMYNNTSTQSKKFFKEDPDSFTAYHDGYKQQVTRWPLNPLDIIIDSIKKMPNDYVIADFGCGEATLAASIEQKTHSFDLISANDRVKACDMAHTPLLTSSVHVAVFCLSLMGSNLSDYILEANRVLKKDGILKIAEIESRFDNIDEFIKLLKIYGFSNTWKDLSQNLFYFLDFKKIKDITTNRKKLPEITLKSCLYKKR